MKKLMLSAAVIAALAFTAYADDDDVTAPDVPAAIQPPVDAKVFLALDADGDQIYECRATATGPAWVFVAPSATLYGDGEVFGRHYVGPTWESNSGSTVVGAVVNRANSPTAGNIPWLLLRAVTTAGPGPFAKVTYIQRVNTVGGVAPPAEGCTDAGIGIRAEVPYTATYYFWKANHK